MSQTGVNRYVELFVLCALTLAVFAGAQARRRKPTGPTLTVVRWCRGPLAPWSASAVDH